ncbi:MAG: ABC transporter permease [Acidobacteria bacterium]|nr:ABC transporter permease [Acidobacteriota bacterium]
MDTLWQDLRYAVRRLGNQPGFTAIAVFSLALGMMATTAIYSVVHAVILDPFPYKDVDDLMSVRVWSAQQSGYRIGYSTDQFMEIDERNSIFEGAIASTISDVLWTDGAEPQRLRGNYGTPNTFQVMGVPPLIGRAFTPDDVKPEAESVAVLGYRFWQRQFGGDPGVVGKRLRLNDRVRTVVGVMPKRFMWRGADVYLPVVFKRGEVIEGVRNVHLLGRLKPGVTEAQASVDLHPIIADLKQREPEAFPDQWQVGLLSFKETFPSSIRENLWILFGAVGLLLLIACANVSNLLLAKAGERQREITVRAALGATRARIVRQLLTESLIIAALGGVLGVVLTIAGLQAILAIVPPNTIPDESEITLNAPVLFFTLGVSLLTSLVFGIAPALHATARDIANPLREIGRSLTGNRKQALLRKGLVVAEIALSLVLLMAAGLMVRSFTAMQNTDLGYAADRVLTMRVGLPERRYPDRDRRIAFYQELLRRIHALPGVVAAGLNTGLQPLGNLNLPVEIVGAAQQDVRPVILHQVSADYTRVLGTPLLAGRLFSESEVDARRQLAVVNQHFVRTRLEGGNPLGQVVRVPRLKTAPWNVQDDSFEIIGVVQDTLNRTMSMEVMPEVYLPYTLAGRSERLVVHAQGDPLGIAKAVASQVYALDKEQPVTDVRTLDRMLQEGIFAGPRFNLVLFSLFGVMGLTLAVVGVYGVMSSTVAQQKQEIGVRMALGATPGQVSAMVVKRGAWLLLTGIALGLTGSLLTMKLLAGYAQKVSIFDPLTFGAVALILLAAGLQACFWPARRASRIDPMIALRTD